MGSGRMRKWALEIPGQEVVIKVRGYRLHEGSLCQVIQSADTEWIQMNQIPTELQTGRHQE